MQYCVEVIKYAKLRYITTIAQNPVGEKLKFNNIRILYMKGLI